MTLNWTTRAASLLIAAAAFATVAGALASQHVFGFVPCKLCLWERWPYYLGIPLGLAAALCPDGPWRRAGLVLLLLLFAGSAALGGYHAGAEWGWWPGPNDCGGGSGAPGTMDDFLRQLERTRVVSCTEAGWRWLGLSFAGWNAVVSALLAALAGAAASMPARVGEAARREGRAAFSLRNAAR